MIPLRLPHKKRARVLTVVCALTACLIVGKLFLAASGVFVINSSSMEPRYPVYSVIIASNKPFENLQSGDVIFFRSDALGGKTVFHRITRITECGVYTKGDNNNIEDNQLVTRDDYIGSELISFTAVGAYLSIIGTPAGFVVLFVLPLIIAILLAGAFELLKYQRFKQK